MFSAVTSAKGKDASGCNGEAEGAEEEWIASY